MIDHDRLIFLLKCGGILILLIIPYMFGLVPFISLKNYLKYESGQSGVSHRKKILMSLCNCFTSGVFISVSIIHIWAEGEKSLSEVFTHRFPVSQMLFIAGYFLVFAFEHVLVPHTHSHNYSEGVNRIESNPSSSRLGYYGSTASSMSGAVLLDYSIPQLNRPTEVKSLTATILTIILSVHSAISGLSIGLLDNVKAIIIILLAVFAHKWLECVSLSISLVKSLPKIPTRIDYDKAVRQISVMSNEDTYQDLSLKSKDGTPRTGTPRGITKELIKDPTKDPEEDVNIPTELKHPGVPKLKLPFSGQRSTSNSPRINSQTSLNPKSGIIYEENDFKAYSRRAYLCIFLYSLMEPGGLGLGWALSSFLKGNALQIVTGTSFCISSGSFLYVAINDILVPEFQPSELEHLLSNRWKFLACMIGLILSSTLIITFDYD